jgi:hypothetical protein
MSTLLTLSMVVLMLTALISTTVSATGYKQFRSSTTICTHDQPCRSTTTECNNNQTCVTTGGNSTISEQPMIETDWFD